MRLIKCNHCGELTEYVVCEVCGHVIDGDWWTGFQDEFD